MYFSGSDQTDKKTMPGPALKSTVSLCGPGPVESSKLRDLYRITVMGAAKVGKTAIVNQFLYDTFVPMYKATVEELHKVEYEVKACPLTLEIMDTSGSYQFPAMRQLYISKSDGFVLVFSVDNEDSLNEVQKIREQIIDKKKCEDVPIVVVANKIDIEADQRQISKEVAEMTVTLDWHSEYLECSAKDNANILNIFTQLFLQANIDYSLKSAVEIQRRRRSLPVYTSNLPFKLKDKSNRKRNSCATQ